MNNKKTKNLTSEQVKNVPNPTGKGGFKDHPELINAGGRPKESPLYWMNQYGALSNAEFSALVKSDQDNLSVNQVLAIAHIAGAGSKLDNRKDLFNRIDGMPTQKTELTGANGNPVEFVVNRDEVKEFEEFREGRRKQDLIQ